MTTQNKENDSIRIGILKKYVGVQSWQMRSLPTLDPYVFFCCHNSESFLPTVLGFNAFMKMHLPTHTRRSERDGPANTKKKYSNCKKSSLTNAKRGEVCLENERIWICLMVPRYSMIPMISSQTS